MTTATQQIVALIIEDHYIEVEKSVAELLKEPPVTVTIDGKKVEVPRTTLATNPATNERFPRPTTIYDAALQVGVKIPILCHREHMTPVAVCRFCCVEVKGQWRLAPACQRQVEAGMEVNTHATSERVRNAVKVLTELLISDHEVPRQAHREYGENELQTIAKQFCPQGSRFRRTAGDRGQDESSMIIAVDHNACILCDRCIRACNEIRNNQVLGRMNKGYKTRIAFDLNDPMGQSSCVSCGECMVSCPTGALTNRKFVGADPWKDITPRPPRVPLDELTKHPLFEGVSKQFLGWNENSIVRRTLQPGEILCREGEFGNTAFIIEEGEVEVFIQTPIKHAGVKKDGKRKPGLFSVVKRLVGLYDRNEDRRDEASPPRYIPVDAPVSLDYDRPIAVLTPADLIFGETSCMNNYPRSATVRAKTRVVVLEILRNVLYVLQRSKKSKAMLDKVYRERAIDGHLRSVPIFAPLTRDQARFKDFVNRFKDHMTLVRLNPGEIVFREKDPADHFYLVRVGFVKVSQKRPGGEHVLNYIGPGGYFGEIGLLSNLPEMRSAGVPPGVRVATCSALDHVDLVRISGSALAEIIEQYPEIRQELLKVAEERLRQNEETLRNLESESLSQFVGQGLMNAQSLLVLDLEKCTRCDECTRACADAHGGVTRLIREGLRFENWLVASSCRSCLDPYCMVGCPVDAIHRLGSREMVIEDWCIGCGNCARNCPYGNINMHPFPTGEYLSDAQGKQVPVLQQKATMCDLCREIDGQPSCVYACPHDAAHRYSGDEFRQVTLGRQK